MNFYMIRLTSGKPSKITKFIFLNLFNQILSQYFFGVKVKNMGTNDLIFSQIAQNYSIKSSAYLQSASTEMNFFKRSDISSLFLSSSCSAM